LLLLISILVFKELRIHLPVFLRRIFPKEFLVSRRDYKLQENKESVNALNNTYNLDFIIKKIRVDIP
jgi:hypothetical protein